MERKQWDKYAKNYHKEIISPLQKKVINPLFSDILKIANRKKLIVADVGTGIGDLLPFLSQNFKKVYAIDFSKKMLKIAKQRNSLVNNIIFKEADLRKLVDLDLKLNMIISVNSILGPSFEQVEKSFEQISGSLKEGGIFIGIFPAMESILYNFMLVYEREYSKVKNEKRALKDTKKISERKKYNFIMGVFDDNGEKQKNYYQFELRNRLKKESFKKIKFKKVLYPWGKGCGDFEDFYGMPKMWDWYVTAIKK